MKNDTHHIQKLLDYLSLSVSAFERSAGIGSSTINKAIDNPEKEFSPATISKIIQKYPSVNPDWLRTGEGPMILKPLKALSLQEIETITGAADPLALFNQYLNQKLSKIDELEKRIEKLEGK